MRPAPVREAGREDRIRSCNRCRVKQEAATLTEIGFRAHGTHLIRRRIGQERGSNGTSPTRLDIAEGVG
jgi:hypothetical protein